MKHTMKIAAVALVVVALAITFTARHYTSNEGTGYAGYVWNTGTVSAVLETKGNPGIALCSDEPNDFVEWFNQTINTNTGC